MTYLPSNYINSNYRYSINNYYYTIRTNRNCYSSYNTTYCDCYDIYFKNDYLVTDAYSCNYNASTNISYSNFSSDFYYRLDLSNIMLIFFVIVTFLYFLAIKPLQRLMGRWLKL